MDQPGAIFSEKPKVVIIHLSHVDRLQSAIDKAKVGPAASGGVVRVS